MIATGATYSSGDILGDVAANPAKIFLALRRTTNAPPHGDWNDDTLVTSTGKPLQYVNRNDLLPVYADTIRFNTGQAGLNLSVSISNRQGETIIPPIETVTEDNKSVALVDIHQLPEDFYTITLADGVVYTNSFSFYRLQSTEAADALISIRVKSNDATYDLIDADKSLKEPVFELRFKNRWTIWRYLGEKFGNAPVSDPQPLTQKGTVGITALNSNGDSISELPNPNIRMIKTEHPSNDKEHYDVVSEIYVH